MKQVFKAILHGDRVEWLDGAPESDGPIQVYVSVTEVKRDDDPEPGQKSMVELFQALADSGAFADIEDPVAWQREQRKDRPLPGRDIDVDR